MSKTESEVYCCPECDSTHYNVTTRLTDSGYLCMDCGARFDHLKTRPGKTPPSKEPGGTIARELEEMDPEEFEDVINGD